MDQNFTSVTDAEQAFYLAFTQQDIEAMMNVWKDAEEIECIHPMGKRIQGVSVIKQSWIDLFAQAPPMQFRIERRKEFCSATLCVHILVEDITVIHSKQRAQMFATNVYEKNQDLWLMVSHHASPNPDTQFRRTPVH